MKKTRKVNDKASSIATKPGILAPKQQSRKTPHRLRWIRYVIIFVILATIAVIVGVNTYSQYIIEREHFKVKTELNEVAYDLHNVYVNLKSTLPNVVESSFKNGCTMSYAGPSTKAYSCGSSAHLYKQKAVDSSIKQAGEIIVLEQKFDNLRGLQTGVSAIGADKYSYSDFLFNSILTSLSCHGYSHIYSDIVSLRQYTGKNFSESSLPVESIELYCSKNLTYPVTLESSWSQ